MKKFISIFKKLRADQSGMALIEFAYTLPILVPMAMWGGELANYATVKMRVSQVALQIADNGSRIGEGSVLASKQVTEANINDILTGAGLQASTLNIYTNGRVYVSSVEPVANPNTTARYKIVWQRCRGAGGQPSVYGQQGDTNLTGIGPTGRKATAPDTGKVIFAQVSYTYQPLFGATWSPPVNMTEIAAMLVRDQRFSGLPSQIAGVTPSGPITASGACT
ncbi:MAG: pilus assembly protein [Chakrabartia sp.]